MESVRCQDFHMALTPLDEEPTSFTSVGSQPTRGAVEPPRLTFSPYAFYTRADAGPRLCVAGRPRV